MSQPPSGGCVLKRDCNWLRCQSLTPAAFRRLCVETAMGKRSRRRRRPAAFRRLCVETLTKAAIPFSVFPAAFRRLCVETSPE